jgi:hypothetical protein
MPESLMRCRPGNTVIPAQSLPRQSCWAGAGIQINAAWTLAPAGVTDATCTDALLDRLVALNAERAAEEAAGRIRWLRPDFQNPSVAVDPQKQAKTVLPQSPASAATTSAQPAEERA